jgi:hypothetical protein
MGGICWFTPEHKDQKRDAIAMQCSINGAQLAVIASSTPVGSGRSALDETSCGRHGRACPGHPERQIAND